MLVAGIVVAISIARGDGAVGEAYEIRSLSSRPDMLTGGDALIGITATRNADVSGLRLFLDGTDVTESFRSSTSGVQTGFVAGLSGVGDLRLAGADGTPRATLALVNHPIEGPEFSGPHQQLFICETEAFELVSGETLGPPLDDACSIERRIDHAYRSTQDGELKPLASPDSRPADLASTTTLTGAAVPYIVRIENGTINCAIYQKGRQ